MVVLKRLGHSHNDQYYTKTEVDTISGSLQVQVDNKSDSNHIHDDRYYTQQEVDDIVSTVSGITDHDILNNLDYDSSGHTGFVSLVDLASTSGVLQSQIDYKSDLGHIHDDRYYTETEVDDIVSTASGSLQLQIDNKSDVGHIHDDRYYTESEVDGLITTTSGTLQTQIDGKAEIIHDHDDLYYTKDESDTISGSLQSQIATKSDLGHIHDDRYYTEDEVDTISGTLQDQIDTKSDVSHIHEGDSYIEITRSGGMTISLAEWEDNTKTKQISSTVINKADWQFSSSVKTIYDYYTGTSGVQEITTTVSRVDDVVNNITSVSVDI